MHGPVHANATVGEFEFDQGRRGHGEDAEGRRSDEDEYRKENVPEEDADQGDADREDAECPKPIALTRDVFVLMCAPTERRVLSGHCPHTTPSPFVVRRGVEKI